MLLSLPVQTVSPSVSPVHLNEVKPLLRIATTDVDVQRDDEIQRYIDTATEQLQEDTLQQYVAATFKLELQEFPGTYGDISLRRGPLLSFSSLTYYDTSNASQTVTASDYFVQDDRWPILIEVDDDGGEWWPQTYERYDAVTATWVAGYAVPLSVDSDNDQFTSTGHTYANGDSFRLSNSGGTLPAGLSSRTTYYVISASGNTFSLSTTSGGSAVTVSSNGSGQLFAGVVPHMARLAIASLAKSWYCGECAAGCTDSAYETLMRRLRWEVAIP